MTKKRTATTKDLFALYQPDIEAARDGVPFVTSRGITVWLLPDWAEEWDRCAVDRAILVKDYLTLAWYEMPADLRDRVTVLEFLTAVVAWDATEPDGSALACTAEQKRRIAAEIRPFTIEVMTEVRRRRTDRTEGLADLGNDSGASSAPSSSIPADPTAPPSDGP